MTSGSRRVFINCPFDDAYKPVFDALLFCVYDCGFAPASALERSDSGEVRFSKIMRLIQICRFGIHDISRTELDDDNGLPRFNMPFELGLFLGCRYADPRRPARKRCLILDREPHRYQKFLSDISGQDIRSHGHDPFVALACVRDWLRSSSADETIPGSDEIAERYRQFQRDLPELCRQLRLTPAKLTFVDRCLLIQRWLGKPAYSLVGRRLE